MRRIPFAFALSLVLSSSAVAEDWPEFRGPGKQGLSPERGLPVSWSETENIAWKVPVAGRGWSSPAIRGNQLWLTSATEEGRSLRALCLNRATGKTLHDVEVFSRPEPGKIHAKNSHASPTPIVRGDRVYLHFGSHGTACLDTKGAILWKSELKYYHRHGPGGSPELFDDLLIINCDGYDEQFIVALDAKTGQVRWKRPRKGRQAYSTPLALQVGGVDQIISAGGNQVTAYDPRTGNELWFCRYDGYSLVPRPVYGDGLLFICTGYESPSIYAIRPDGSGDVTDSHVAWSLKKGAPLNPSPILVGHELYFVSDGGVASCVDSQTGKVHWQKRLGGDYSASPVFADGRIYFTSEEGATTVVAAAKQYAELAKNQLDGRTLASLAISNGAIFQRTENHLYRIENPSKLPQRAAR